MTGKQSCFKLQFKLLLILCGTVSFKGLSQLRIDMETKQTNRMVRIKNKQVNEISARVTGTPTNLARTLPLYQYLPKLLLLLLLSLFVAQFKSAGYIFSFMSSLSLSLRSAAQLSVNYSFAQRRKVIRPDGRERDSKVTTTTTYSHRAFQIISFD